MTVTDVLNRIGEIRRQFGAAGPETGFALSDAPQTDGRTVAAAERPSPGGVIVGQMGGLAPTVTAVETQHARLDQISTAPISDQAILNLSPPLPAMDIASEYGMRLHPIHGDHRMHHGIDLDADAGTPVSTISDGIVTFAGERGGYGNLVIVDHGGGYETRYGHQEQLTVMEGDLLRSGDVIGYVGSTGASTGPHLHFEVRRDGVSVDPEPWLRY